MFYTAEDTDTSHDAALLIPYAFHTLEAGGAALRGTRHPGEIQDALWPSNLWETETRGQPLELQLDVSPETQRRLGRLYVVADGVTHCANGLIAARLAAQTIGRTYYEEGGSPDWRQRLTKAFNEAHTQLLKWQKLYYCAYSRKHRDGQPRHVKPGEVIWHNGQALCPLCQEPLRGLLSTAVALVIGDVPGARRVIVGGIGDSRIFRLSPDGPARSLYAPREKEFLGWPRLVLRPEVQEIQVRPEELILLGSDGFFSNLNGRYYDEWAAPLRRRLRADNLHAEAASLVRELSNWGRERDNPTWHDDVALIAVHTGRPNTLALEDEPRFAQRATPRVNSRGVKASRGRPMQHIMPTPTANTQEGLRLTRDEVFGYSVPREDTHGRLAPPFDTSPGGVADVQPTHADAQTSSDAEPSKGRKRMLAGLALFVVAMLAIVFLVANQDGTRRAASEATRAAILLTAPSLRPDQATPPLPAASLIPTATPLAPTSLPAAAPLATPTLALPTSTPPSAMPAGAAVLPPVPLAAGPRLGLDTLSENDVTALMGQLGYTTQTAAEQEAAEAHAAAQANAGVLEPPPQPGFLPPRPYQYLFSGHLKPFAPASAGKELTLHPAYDSGVSLRLAAPAQSAELAALSDWAKSGQPVWVLATSDTLDNTIVDCRNTRPDSALQPCRLTQVLGQSDNLLLEPRVVLGIEDKTLRPLWLAEAVSQGTAPALWTFADLGPQGIPLGLNGHDRDQLGARGGQYGLLSGQMVVEDGAGRFQLSRPYVFVLPANSDPNALYQRQLLGSIEEMQ